MNHLTDDQIQNYLDNINSENIIEIKNHLQDCERCRTNLNAYEQIYSIISNEVELPEMSGNFAAATISRIEKTNEKKWNIFENMIVSVMFAVSLIISIYFLDFLNVFYYFREIDFSLFRGLGNKLITSLSPNIIYLTAAILITGIIELLDRFKIQKSLKHLNH